LIAHPCRARTGTRYFRPNRYAQDKKAKAEKAERKKVEKIEEKKTKRRAKKTRKIKKGPWEPGGF